MQHSADPVQWLGAFEPYHDATGRFGEPRDLSQAQIETIRSFFELVLSDGRKV